MDLKQQLSASEGENKQLKIQVGNLEKKLDDYGTTIDGQRKSYASLDVKFKEIGILKQKLEIRVSELEAANASKQVEIDSLQSKYDEIVAERDQLKTKLDENEEYQIGLLSRLVEQGEKINELTIDCESASMSNEELLAQLIRLHDEKVAIENDYKKLQQSYTGTIDEFNLFGIEFEQKVKQQNASIEKLVTENIDLKKTIDKKIDINDYSLEDFQLNNYKTHPVISMKMIA